MTYHRFFYPCAFFILIFLIGTSLSGQRHLILDQPITPNGPLVEEADTWPVKQ